MSNVERLQTINNVKWILRVLCIAKHSLRFSRAELSFFLKRSVFSTWMNVLKNPYWISIHLLIYPIFGILSTWYWEICNYKRLKIPSVRLCNVLELFVSHYFEMPGILPKNVNNKNYRTFRGHIILFQCRIISFQLDRSWK